MLEINAKDKTLEVVKKAYELSERCVKISWNTIFNELIPLIIDELSILENEIKKDQVTTYYYALFSEILSNYNQATYEFLNKYSETDDKQNYSPYETIRLGRELLYVRYLFSNLGYFNSNIVIAGANGSGKTILANTLKDIITSKSGVVIPAQKIMVVPSYSGLFSSATTRKNLKEFQEKKRDGKVTFDVSKDDSMPYEYIRSMGQDFKIILDNLLSENNEMIHQRDATRKLGESVDYSIESKLEKTIKIWESLIKHRKIECRNGYDLKLSSDGIKSYPLYGMSDGEKVTLYNISHVIQAPENSIITVDEPEMYLHKTIANQLWNKLEEVRSDCLFIYLTHDLEFAVGRASSKKIWIRNFEYNTDVLHNKHKWDIQPLPETKIPDELLMRLLGSRKTILFCEGKDNKSLDKQIYEIIFPDLTIIPVVSCKEVIDHTKSYNKIPNLNTKAIGVIDRDHREETQLSCLKLSNIHALPFAEVENLFFCEEFLKLYISKYDEEPEIVELIKGKVMETLAKQKELQISNFVSSKINYYFTETHVDKANVKDSIVKNLSKFQSKIDIDEWYANREIEVKKIIADGDYNQAIKIFNNKGLFAIANECFKVNNFQDRAMKYLKNNKEAQITILNNFPSEISSKNNEL